MRLKIVPDEHQMRGLEKGIPRRTALYSFATGTGKSLIQIVSGMELLRRNVCDKFLFVGTMNTCVELGRDLEEFAEHTAFTVRNRADLEHFLTEEENPFALVRYECFDSREALELLPLFKARKVGVSFDEFHKLKNPNSIVHRAYKTLRASLAACYGATATPLMSNLTDLYHLVNYLVPGFLGTLKDFQKRYFVRVLQEIPVKGGKRWAYKHVGYQNLEELKKRLEDVVITFYPDYDIRYETRWGEVEDLEAYRDAVNGIFYDEKGKRVQKTHHSARMMTLQRAVNHDPGKIRPFREAVETHRDHGVLVFCSYYDSLDVVSQTLTEMGVPHDTISGEVTKPSERRRIMDAFNADPRGKALLLTLAGGQSLNLQSTNRLIFYDVPFGAGAYIQVLGRVARYYSKHKTFYITFVALRETIDHYKLEYVEQNQEAIKAVLGNEMGVQTQLPKFNSYLLDKLRKQLMWARKKRKASVS